MALFKPGMFRKRVEREPVPKEQDTPAAPPVVECDVCCVEGHVRDACPSAIRPGDVGRTWRSGGNSDMGGTGDTFEAVQAFWRRFRGEA